ncbi:hypothetical protein [Ferrimonas balearica]|uniref:hypothetical protein n=1 Tax=Ferrimonas balearica TaxID=44012 RepID=UPI001C99E0B3|nr:hypothetical protein [Ferrimonas balearica]MBY5992944.1 hypothetical protein [Ferrimonas balearica]
MDKFKYFTNFMPVRYREHTDESDGLLKTMFSGHPQTPAAESLYEDSEFLEMMTGMGEHGWELVTVQPLLEGVKDVTSSSPGGGYGYSITAGYYLFWKQRITD